MSLVLSSCCQKYLLCYCNTNSPQHYCGVQRNEASVRRQFININKSILFAMYVRLTNFHFQFLHSVKGMLLNMWCNLLPPHHILLCHSCRSHWQWARSLWNMRIVPRKIRYQFPLTPIDNCNLQCSCRCRYSLQSYYMRKILGNSTRIFRRRFLRHRENCHYMQNHQYTILP